MKRKVALRSASFVVAAGVAAVMSQAPAQAAAPGASVHVAVTTKIHVLRAPSAIRAVGTVVGAAMPYTGGTPPLVYDNSGASNPQVAKTMKMYAIYWSPGHLQSGQATTIPTSYKNLIQRFMRDYSHNGLANNNTQYFGFSGTRFNNISNTTVYGGAFVYNAPFPVGHCSTSETGSNCIIDADIQAAAQNAAAAHHLQAGTSTEFFVYTPYGEGSCIDGSDSHCSYSYYCAYHGATSAIFGSFSNLIYANQPWPTSPTGNSCFSPGSGQTFPNHNVNADASINVTSHELTESITDPLLNNWYDSSGFEIGDECAWEFGPTVTGGGDVRWNNHPYSMQPEASNASAGCVLNGP